MDLPTIPPDVAAASYLAYCKSLISRINEITPLQASNIWVGEGQLGSEVPQCLECWCSWNIEVGEGHPSTSLYLVVIPTPKSILIGLDDESEHTKFLQYPWSEMHRVVERVAIKDWKGMLAEQLGTT